jgi:predicted HTH transcriptional regulator
MDDIKEPTRAWKGTWIPKEIWENQEITWMEKCIWAEIFNLDDETKGGCWASNAFLAKKFNTSPQTITNAICNLKKLGLLKQISFNGRQRVLKSIYLD